MAYNLVGQRFGKLFVEKQLETDSHGERKWLCICDCGNKHEVTSYNLVHGKTTRCAICSNKAVAEKQFVHGRKPTHLFNCFANMNTRCYNPNYYLFQHIFIHLNHHYPLIYQFSLFLIHLVFQLH